MIDDTVEGLRRSAATEGFPEEWDLATLCGRLSSTLYPVKVIR